MEPRQLREPTRAPTLSFLAAADVAVGRWSLLKTLDLFSGVGGNSLGLVGYTKTIAYCESDPHAVAVLRSRIRDGLLSKAPVFRDIKALSGMQLPDRPDILVGGFPCQGISLAGKGRGISGDHRSGLFYEIMRLTDLCDEPFYASEYAPPVANPHQRGLPEEGPGQPPAGSSGESAGGAWPTEPGLGRVADRPADWMDQGLPGHLGRDYWKEEPGPRTTDIKDQRVERIKRLGNGVVPLQARVAFERLMFGEDLYDGQLEF